MPLEVRFGLLKRLLPRSSPRSEQGTQSEDNARHQRNHDGKHQHLGRLPQSPRLATGRQVTGGERRHSNRRKHEPRNAADAGQKQALRQKLLREPCAAGSERNPHRHSLAVAPRPGSAAGWPRWRRRSAAPVQPRPAASRHVLIRLAACPIELLLHCRSVPADESNLIPE